MQFLPYKGCLHQTTAEKPQSTQELNQAIAEWITEEEDQRFRRTRLSQALSRVFIPFNNHETVVEFYQKLQELRRLARSNRLRDGLPGLSSSDLLH